MLADYEIEAEHGELSPPMYREPRGSFFIPHSDEGGAS
jgi:hypothetical protein